MTMPDERYRAMVEGLKLIEDLLIPQVTPRVPGDVRERARWIMRHHPSQRELVQLASKVPDMLSTKDYNGNTIK
jgi:hypothetical protein